MPASELVRCRSCHRPIRLVLTEKGRRMPLDPDPAGRSVGLERVTFSGPAPSLAIREGRVHVLRPDEPWDGDLFVSHFATCPEARRWNRKILRRAADRTRARVFDDLEGEQ